MTPRPLLLVGAGGLARELLAWVAVLDTLTHASPCTPRSVEERE